MWHNYKWRHKLGLQASAVIMMLTNNAMNVCLWRENFAGILFQVLALVDVLYEQIFFLFKSMKLSAENFYLRFLVQPDRKQTKDGNRGEQFSS